VRSKGLFRAFFVVFCVLAAAKIALGLFYFKEAQYKGEALANEKYKGKGEVMDPNDLMEKLKKRQEALRKKEQELERLEARLKPLQAEVEAKMAELTELQRKLAAYAKKLAEREKALKDAQMAHLVSLYSAMDPAKAAAIMDKLSLETVVKIMKNMKGKSAGKILAMMDPQKGAKISEALSRVK